MTSSAPSKSACQRSALLEFFVRIRRGEPICLTGREFPPVVTGETEVGEASDELKALASLIHRLRQDRDVLNAASISVDSKVAAARRVRATRLDALYVIAQAMMAEIAAEGDADHSVILQYRLALRRDWKIVAAPTVMSDAEVFSMIGKLER